jgi:hypothetical protein
VRSRLMAGLAMLLLLIPPAASPANATAPSGDRPASLDPRSDRASVPAAGRLGPSVDVSDPARIRLPGGSGTVGAAALPSASAAQPPDADRDPVAALAWELSHTEESDGFLIVLAEPTLTEHVRSLLTTLRPVDVPARAERLVRDNGGQVERRFDGLGQMLVDVAPEAAARLAAHPAVRSVSPNSQVWTAVRTSDVQRSDPFLPLGLEMLDAASTTGGDLFDSSYRWTSDGSGVEVYVFDTGIQADHPDLVGRVPAPPEGGWFSIAADTVPPDADCHGHGTHVAGTIAGRLSGVAKGATLIPVKVFPDCARSGSSSDIVAGINWLRTQYPSVAGRPTADRPIVANLSLGVLGTNEALDAAVRTLVGDGVHVVVAAGNRGAPVENFSPARVAEVLTVGATGFVQNGRLFVNIEAPYSNFGAGVDLFALGTFVESACTSANELDDGVAAPCTDVVVGGVTYPVVASTGTSMAAPHVAGALARLVGAAWAADRSLIAPAAAATTLTAGALDAVVLLGSDPPASWSRSFLNSRVLEPAPPTPADPVPYPAVVPCTLGPAASSLGQLVGGAAPHSWQLTSGTLPGSLLLSSGGRISGSGVTAFGSGTLVVSDAFGRSAEWTVDLSRFSGGCP